MGSLIERTLDCAFCVHRHFGPGLLESVYQKALEIELEESGIPFQAQMPIPVRYRGRDLGTAFRLDILIDKCILIELKAVAKLEPVHFAQMLTYLKLLQLKTGYFLNFNVKLFKDGIHRIGA